MVWYTNGIKILDQNIQNQVQKVQFFKISSFLQNCFLCSCLDCSIWHSFCSFSYSRLMTSEEGFYTVGTHSTVEKRAKRMPDTSRDYLCWYRWNGDVTPTRDAKKVQVFNGQFKIAANIPLPDLSPTELHVQNLDPHCIWMIAVFGCPVFWSSLYVLGEVTCDQPEGGGLDTDVELRALVDDRVRSSNQTHL